MLAWMVCFLPLGSIKRHVNSSTEAETICSLIWVRGNVASKVRISSFNTFKQAIILFLTEINSAVQSLHFFFCSIFFLYKTSFSQKVCLIVKIFFLWILKERENSFVVNLGLGSNRERVRHKWNQIVRQIDAFNWKCKQNIKNRIIKYFFPF